MRHHKSSIVYTCNNRIYRPKKYFMFPRVIMFCCCFVEALGNCPVCPPASRGPSESMSFLLLI